MVKRSDPAPFRRRRVRRKNHSQYLRPPPTEITTFEECGSSGNGVSTSSQQKQVHSLGRDSGTKRLDFRASLPHPATVFSVSGQQRLEWEQALELGDQMLHDDVDQDPILSEAYLDISNIAESQQQITDSDRPTSSRRLKSTDVFTMLTEGKTLAAVFNVVGTKRLSVCDYNILRRHANFQAEAEERGPFPSYSKIQQYIFPLLRRHVYVPTETLKLTVNVKRAGAPRATLGPHGDLVALEVDVRMVKISAWGSRDLASLRCGEVLNGHGTSTRSEQSLFDSIEEAQVVRNRLQVLNAALTFTTEKVGEFDVPSWHLHESRGRVDIWIRPAKRQVIDFHSLHLHSVGSRLLVLRGVYILRTWMATEMSPRHDIADVVAELDSNSAADTTVGDSRLQLFIVQKMKRRLDMPTFHLLVQEDVGEETLRTRVRCVRISPSHGPHIALGRGLVAPPANGLSRRSNGNGIFTGVLNDGRKFIVYRVILFADDFDPLLGRRGSAGGLYLLPVGIPIKHRTGVKGIHVLSMTPPGVSTGQMLLSIIPDIIEGTVKGFRVCDANGEVYQMFLDVVGYECDYFAVQEESDLRGHNSIAPCNCCTFQQGNRHGRNRSNYAYTTAIHSGNGVFRRDASRMEAIRKVYRTEEELKSVGLRDITSTARRKLPLHALHVALREARGNVPLDCDGNPAVPASFDPYLSIVIAPDHLFSNLIKDVVNANIKSLTVKQRALAHALIVDSLRAHGLQTESAYVDESDGSLHAMSMSALYNVIMVAPWAFCLARSANTSGDIRFTQNGNAEIVSLSFMLRELIADTTFYARVERDGWALVEQFTSAGWTARERKLKLKAMQYVSALDICCGKSETQAKELDKPNVHRLIELYVHTIPTFGHVRQYQELALERTHQPLKRALVNSNFRNAQLQAMDHILGDEWKASLQKATRGVKDPNGLTEEHFMDLKRSLLGTSHTTTAVTLPMLPIKRVFDRALLADISEFSSVKHRCPGGNTSWMDDEIAWVGSGEHSNRDTGYLWAEVNNRARAVLKAVVEANLSQRCHLNSSMRASLQQRWNGATKLPVRGAFDSNIRRDDIVQALVSISTIDGAEQNGNMRIKLLTPETTTEDCSQVTIRSAPTFWYVTEIIEIRPSAKLGGYNCESFAVVLSLSKKKSSPQAEPDMSINWSANEALSKALPPVFVLDPSSSTVAYLLPLYPGVIKPMRLHACSGSCNFDDSGKLFHDVGDNRNAGWILFGSVDGFPPRSG